MQGPALGIISAGTSPTNLAAFFGNYVKASALKIIKASNVALAALLKSMAFPMEEPWAYAALLSE